jgi:hypothetical protein
MHTRCEHGSAAEAQDIGTAAIGARGLGDVDVCQRGMEMADAVRSALLFSVAVRLLRLLGWRGEAAVETA